MRPFPLLFLALVLALPEPARSQERVPSARLTLAPLLGARVPLLRDQRTTVVVPSLVQPLVVRFGPAQSVGGVGGAMADLRLVGPVGVTGAFLYTAGDPLGVLLVGEKGAVTHFSVAGPSVWFFNAGLSYRLPDIATDDAEFLPAGYVTAGPALIRQDFRGSALERSPSEEVESWGMHLAYRAQFPLGMRHLVLQASIEDYIPFWNRDGEGPRLRQPIELERERVLVTDLRYNRTHIFMLNVGLALRL